MKKKMPKTAKQLAFCAISVALGLVLSNYAKIHLFPAGGSITVLSMLVICLPGYWFGLPAGLASALAFSLVNLCFGIYIVHPVQLAFDYFLAFMALGLSGIFSNKKNGLIKGYIAGVFGRYVFAVLSGWIFFGEWAWEGWSPALYSLVYNGIYIFTEMAITLVILSIPAVRKAMDYVKKMATE